MNKYIVTAHYATCHGNMASCRRIVEAPDSGKALEILALRIKGWKRYMGKLSMDAVGIKSQ
jgi:hypothetical protein